MYSYEKINSKDVYIVEHHHHAIEPWALIRSKLETEPLLLNLDHHPDCLPAFQGFILDQVGDNVKEQDKLRCHLFQEVDINSIHSLQKTIEKLRYDEHIHAATLSGIIDYAFVIQMMDSTGTRSEEQKEYMQRSFPVGLLPDTSIPEPSPPFTYTLPDKKIFVIGTLCLPWCKRQPHNDECIPELYNNVLEDDFLNAKISEANEMAKSMGVTNIIDQSYILDIDLDYFHTKRSVKPEKIETFLGLIRHAEAITIALEPGCVKDLQLAGENLTSEYLLEKIKSCISRV
ncbi:MAG: UPF0489 family protein [Candidatus Cloacimonetes bacterium]|jgi:acetolactate synthase small subunit|nr:UPF0489 family protein [Candidatus Cloacimonadota bacterium]